MVHTSAQAAVCMKGSASWWQASRTHRVVRAKHRPLPSPSSRVERSSEPGALRPFINQTAAEPTPTPSQPSGPSRAPKKTEPSTAASKASLLARPTPAA
ncbi:hypothetical protein D3C81_1594360 [compost metagenome]